MVKQLDALVNGIDAATGELERSMEETGGKDMTAQAFHIRDEVIDRMEKLRALCDEAETVTAASYWPFPTYGDLLFGV